MAAVVSPARPRVPAPRTGSARGDDAQAGTRSVDRRAAPGRGFLGRWRSGDVVALAVLVCLPLAAYALPAALGHPVWPGDDATQNFPLRVLVGHQLRSGHLPIYDPAIWSGTPLLAGWNAGAAYPFTWVFAVLPAVGAWTVNLLATSWVAGLGLYAFLRANRLGPLPAALGAVSFAFAGAMDAQVVHFGLVAGASWIPVQLLAVLRLSAVTETRSRARWCALLVLASAMTLLAGEPRAIDVALFVTGPYTLWQLARSPGRRSLFAWTAIAVVMAGALGAVQLVPGLHAVADSQRATTTFSLYDSGSYPLGWLLVLFEPNLLGGSGSFGAPTFLGNYNLTEVTAYVGVLPWVAAAALLAQLRRHRGVPEWLVWEGVAAVGIVLALGGNTPAWHLLIRIPLFGSQRLQNRNILVTDLALAVLLAFWLDHWLAERRSVGAGVAVSRREQWFGVVPAVAVAATGVVSIAWGAGMLRWLGVSRALANQDGSLRPWFLPTVVLGLSAALLVVGGPRVSRRRRGLLVTGLVAVDLVSFAVTSLLQVAPGPGRAGPPATVASVAAAAADPPGTAVPAADLGIPGRFAVYDPGLFGGIQLRAVGAPDANVVVGGWSIQGYSSIVNGAYARATGAHGVTGHGQDVLSVAAVGDGALDQLDPGALLTVPQYLVTNASERSPGQSGATDPPDPAAGSRNLAPGRIARWSFGEPVDVTSVRIPVSARRTVPVAASVAGSGGSGGSGGSEIQVGLVLPGGTVRWLDPVRGPQRGSTGETTVSLTTPGRDGIRAVGLAARTLGVPPIADHVGVPVVRTGSGVTLDVDGVLQAALSGSQWRYVDQDGPFAVFAATHPSPPLLLRPRPGRSLGRATVRRSSGPALAPSSAVVTSPHGAEVVRAVAAIPGWSATWLPAGGGTPRALAVFRTGIVQAVDVPPGRGVVTWHYDGPGVRTGELAAGAGLLGLAALLVVGRRRSRRSPSGVGEVRVAGPDGASRAAGAGRRPGDRPAWPSPRPSSRSVSH